jgi:hypothetical protein
VLGHVSFLLYVRSIIHFVCPYASVAAAVWNDASGSLTGRSLRLAGSSEKAAMAPMADTPAATRQPRLNPWKNAAEVLACHYATSSHVRR